MSEQSPVMVGITAKAEVERMAMRREGSPAIVASQCLGHAPEFVEDADRAVGLHMTNEMHASRCDRQGGREAAALGGGKPGPVLGALALRRGHALQGRRTVVVHIPLEETRTLTADVAKAAKAMAWPKGWALPQPVQLFDLKIVFGFSERQKDQFDADVQTQPRELPHHALDFVAPPEEGVVVELQKARNALVLPGCQDVSLGGPQLFGAGQGLRQGAGAQIEGVEGVDLGAARQIPAGPVQRIQAACHLLAWGWKVRSGMPGLRGQQGGLLQSPVNSRSRGHGAPRPQLPEFVANGAGPNQAGWGFLQPLARPHDQVPHCARPRLGLGVRPARLTAQACRPLLAKAGPPLRQPRPTAPYTFFHCTRFLTQAQPSHRLAAQPAFGSLVHASSHVGACNRISRLLSCHPVSDVLVLLQAKTVSDVLVHDI